MTEDKRLSGYSIRRNYARWRSTRLTPPALFRPPVVPNSARFAWFATHLFKRSRATNRNEWNTHGAADQKEMKTEQERNVAHRVLSTERSKAAADTADTYGTKFIASYGNNIRDIKGAGYHRSKIWLFRNR